MVVCFDVLVLGVDCCLVMWCMFLDFVVVVVLGLVYCWVLWCVGWLFGCSLAGCWLLCLCV